MFHIDFLQHVAFRARVTAGTAALSSHPWARNSCQRPIIKAAGSRGRSGWAIVKTPDTEPDSACAALLDFFLTDLADDSLAGQPYSSLRRRSGGFY